MTYFLGWDVGAWNSDSGDSRDALYALNGEDLDGLQPVGRAGGYRPVPGAPFREEIQNAALPDFLLHLLGIDDPGARVVLAIDAPLSWPRAMLKLTRHEVPVEQVPAADLQNPMVFRLTERRLERFRPVSAVRNQIGSQATKAQYFLRRFGLGVTAPGVWSNGSDWTALETFPRVTRRSQTARRRLQPLLDRTLPVETRTRNPNVFAEKRDALLCAYAAALWQLAQDQLEAPPMDHREEVLEEGWIWVPTDSDADVRVGADW